MVSSSIRGERRAATGHKSGGATTTSDPRTTTVTDIALAHQLFAASVRVGSGLGHQHPRGGPRAQRYRSYLQSTIENDFDIRWAQAWLARAQTFDDGTLVPEAVMCSGGGSTAGATTRLPSPHQSRHQSQPQPPLPVPTSQFQRRLLLQPEDESGYTPLHTAMLARNLAALVLYLRQAYYAEEEETTRGGRWWTPYRSLMHLLHPTTTTTDESNTTNKTSLLRAMTNARDHEGLTPGQLLGKLQRSELGQCRNSLSSFHTPPPSVENNGDDAAATTTSRGETDVVRARSNVMPLD